MCTRKMGWIRCACVGVLASNVEATIPHSNMCRNRLPNLRTHDSGYLSKSSVCTAGRPRRQGGRIAQALAEACRKHGRRARCIAHAIASGTVRTCRRWHRGLRKARNAGITIRITLTGYRYRFNILTGVLKGPARKHGAGCCPAGVSPERCSDAAIRMTRPWSFQPPRIRQNIITRRRFLTSARTVEPSRAALSAPVFCRWRQPSA